MIKYKEYTLGIKEQTFPNPPPVGSQIKMCPKGNWSLTTYFGELLSDIKIDQLADDWHDTLIRIPIEEGIMRKFTFFNDGDVLNIVVTIEAELTYLHKPIFKAALEGAILKTLEDLNIEYKLPNSLVHSVACECVKIGEVE